MTLHECVCAQLLSRVQLFMTPMTVACQASLSMGFSRQEYWSGLPSPPLGDLPDLGIEPMSLTSSALTCRFFTTSTTWETLCDVSVQFSSVQSLSRLRLFVTP